MAQYAYKYRCGHEGHVRLSGPTSDREWELRRREARLCRDCYIDSVADRDAKPRWHAVRNDIRWMPDLTPVYSREFRIGRAYSDWPKIMARGYRLDDQLSEDERNMHLAIHREVPRRYWRRIIADPALQSTEVEWLTAQGWQEGALGPEESKAPPISAGALLATFASRDTLIDETLGRIRRALTRSKQPYVAFSGGKDSVVLLALVHTVDPNVELVWSDDELEYDETVALMERFREEHGPLMRINLGHPSGPGHAGWFRPWAEYPYWREPLPDSYHIDMTMEQWAPEEGYDLTFTGIRAEESQVRANWLRHAAHNPAATYRTKEGRRCTPLWDWTAVDIWTFIRRFNLAYCAVYDVLHAAGISPEATRVGPLPLTPRAHLLLGWPDMLTRLEARYGQRWS